MADLPDFDSMPDESQAHLPDFDSMPDESQRPQPPAASGQTMHQVEAAARRGLASGAPDQAAWGHDVINVPNEPDPHQKPGGLAGEWGQAAIGAGEGAAGSIAGGMIGDIEGTARQLAHTFDKNISTDTTVPTSTEGGYLGKKGLNLIDPSANEDRAVGAMAASMLAAGKLLPKVAPPAWTKVGRPVVNRFVNLDEPPPPPPGAPPAETGLPKVVDFRRPRLDPQGQPTSPPLLPPETTSANLPKTASAGAATISPLEGIAPEAIQQVHGALKEAGFTPYTLEQKLEEMSPHQFAFETSDPLWNSAEGIHIDGGQGGMDLRQANAQRLKEAPQRVTQILDNSLGAKEDLSMLARVERVDQMKAADPLYQKFKSLKITPTPAIKDVMEDLQNVPGIFGTAARLAKLKRVPFDQNFFTTGSQKAFPTAESWDMVKQALDEKIGRTYRAVEGDPVPRATVWTREYTRIRNKLVDAIDNHPDPNIAGVWKDARSTYAAPEQVRVARDLGSRLLNESIDPNELPFMTATYSPAQMAATRQGLRNYLGNMMGRAGNATTNTVTKLLGPNAQSKVRWVLGDQEADQLIKDLEAEKDMRNSSQLMNGNSRTAKRTANREIWQPTGTGFVGRALNIGHAVLHPHTGIPKLAAEHGVKWWDARAAAKAATIRDDASKIYLMQGPQRDSVLKWILEHGENYGGNGGITPMPVEQAIPHARGGAVNRDDGGGIGPVGSANEEHIGSSGMPLGPPPGPHTGQLLQMQPLSPDNPSEYHVRAPLVGMMGARPPTTPPKLTEEDFSAPPSSPAALKFWDPTAPEMTMKEREATFPPDRPPYVQTGTPHEAWINPAQATSVKGEAIPTAPRLSNLDALQNTPASGKAKDTPYETNVNLVSKYPGQDIPPRANTDTKAESFINQAKDNLIWLYNKFGEKFGNDVRDRASKWYDGANAIAKSWADEFNLPIQNVAGMLARLSPKTDWYQNVAMGRRILDTHRDQYETPMTPEMEEHIANTESLNKYGDLFNYLKGKSMKDIDNDVPFAGDPTGNMKVASQSALKAMWIRAYDEAHGDPSFHEVLPEGGFGNKVMKDSDPTQPEKIGWQTLPNIARAIEIMHSGGNPESISDNLGERHKIRSFYNNILVPESPLSTTIDTHAVAAALLRPLSQKSVEVLHNFKLTPDKVDQAKIPDWQSAAGSAKTGVQGTYPLYQEAYERAAKELGILPRQLQSITWEGVRGLFPDTFKSSAANKRIIDDVWRQFASGQRGIDQTRELIHEKAGGIKPPSWINTPASGPSRPNGGANEALQHPPNPEGLPQPVLHGQAPGQVGPGGGGGPTPRSEEINGPQGTGRGPSGTGGLEEGAGAAEAASLREAQARAKEVAGGREPLVGLPQAPIKAAGNYVPGPNGLIHDIAEGYMHDEGLPYDPVKTYAKVDPERAARIARAYDEMKHDPENPGVKASYNALIDETLAQYNAIKQAGYKFDFIRPDMEDPYAATPRLAAKDLIDNHHLWVFPTESGFGTVHDIQNNPLLRPTDEYINGKRLTANDVFRIVHDIFGHFKDGNGFRAEGEENAWRSHSAMYSDLARPAMTAETRGQNSWVNYGPHGEKNRSAKSADTVYADQKTGMLPDWVIDEGRRARGGRVDSAPLRGARKAKDGQWYVADPSRPGKYLRIHHGRQSAA